MGADVQTLSRFVNVLQSGSKREKKSALDDLSDVIEKAPKELLVEIQSQVHNQLILSFQDPVESVREGALLVSRQLIERLDVDKSHVCLLLPALYPRVCREKDPENSEELRLIIGKFLISLVERYERNLSPYVTEMVDMTCRLLRDPSPDIKRTSSELVVCLVKKLPQDTFKYTGKLWPPLVENITHQRWRVRVGSTEALEWLMIKGDNKCVPDVTPALNKKMLDSMYQVRLALVKLAGHWMVELPDRYSFFAHLIPIVLSGLADESDEVVREATRLWDAAGDLYLRENETDLKDKINYEPDKLDHYPPGVVRPNLGCRVLIEREAAKFLLALCHELTDWVEIVRIKASTLLTQVTLHFEHSITMSIRKIIGQICRAARDRDTPLVVHNVKQAAEYMGYFIPADTYCKLIVEYMKEAHEGELLVVAALVRGTPRADLTENLPDIATLLVHRTFKGREQLGYLDLIESVLKVCQSDSFKIGNEIWSCLVSVAGLAEGEQIRAQAVALLDEFAFLGGGDKRKVFGRYCDPLLTQLPDTVWTVHCHEQFILQALVNVAGQVVGDHVEQTLSVLRSALKPETDPEVLLKVMMTVNSLMDNADVTLPTDEAMAKFVTSLLGELLPPHLKWTAGRSAEAIRTVATTCLYMCLCKVSSQSDNTSPPAKLQSPPKLSTIAIETVSQLPSSSTNFKLPDDDEDDQIPQIQCPQATIYGLAGYVELLLPLIMSLVQDPAPKTRLLALNCLKLFASNDAPHNPEHYTTIISQTIKRLDDSARSVRSEAVRVISAYYSQHLQRRTKDTLNTALLDFVYSTLLIHLDDTDPALKQLVLECLKTASNANPHSLRAKVQPDNFRDKEVCQQLIESLEVKMNSLKC